MKVDNILFDFPRLLRQYVELLRGEADDVVVDKDVVDNEKLWTIAGLDVAGMGVPA